MKMKLLLIAFLLIAGASLSLAQGELLTDGHSLKRCLDIMEKAKKGEELTAQEQTIAGYGLGYFKGFSDANALTQAIGVAFPFKVPGTVSFFDSAMAVKKYIENHPESLDLQAALLVAVAFKEQYPNPDYKPPK